MSAIEPTNEQLARQHREGMPVIRVVKNPEKPCMGYAIVDGVTTAAIFDGKVGSGWVTDPRKAKPLGEAAPPPATGPEISEAAKRLADENDISIRSIRGTGKGGFIKVQDVKDAIDAAANPPPKEK